VSGVKDVSVDIQIEILKQCVANVSVLAMPAFLMGQNKSDSIHILEIVGIFLTLVCWFAENRADT
jgi:hypothetical protein